MQAKSGAPAAPVVSTVTANSNQQLKQPPVSKVDFLSINIFQKYPQI